MRVTHSLDGNGSVNGTKTNPEAMVNGDDEHVLLNSGNGGIINNNPKIPSQIGKGAQLASEDDAHNGEKAGPNNLSLECGSGIPVDLGLLGTKQSPPIQVMGRSNVPDPSRIPSSVFARTKSTTPMEWSVASNESLFSIHVGNSSFSRDHVFLLGRSGELANFYNSPPDVHPPVPTIFDSDAKNLDLGNDLEQAVTTEATNAEAIKKVSRGAADGHADKDEPPTDSIPHSASTSRRSDASVTSIQSFAFPILTDGRSGSINVEPVRRQQQPQLQEQQQLKAAEVQRETPEVVLPSAAQKKWFPCFSCSFFRR